MSVVIAALVKEAGGVVFRTASRRALDKYTTIDTS